MISERLEVARMAIMNCAAGDQLTPSQATVVAKAVIEALGDHDAAEEEELERINSMTQGE
jgi:hypothetical protein